MNALRIAAALLFTALAGCATTAPSIDAARSQLAPTGKIRLAVPNNPNYLSMPANPPYSGVAVDIGNALSRKVGAPFEIVVYQTIPELLGDAATKWDVTLIGIEESRRAIVDYTVPYAITQNTYLVPAGSALMTVRDLDKGGVRIGASQGSMQHTHLKANLKSATLINTGTVSAGVEELKVGRLDAVAANRPTLEEQAAKMPGYRVVSGSFMDVRYGMAVPRGRSAAAVVADELIRDMRARGEIAAILSRAKLSLKVPTD